MDLGRLGLLAPKAMLGIQAPKAAPDPQAHRESKATRGRVALLAPPGPREVLDPRALSARPDLREQPDRLDPLAPTVRPA